MMIQTENKPQLWRAVAVFEDRPECLIYLGRSVNQVKANFPAAYFEVLDADERAQVQSIALQKWHGAPDAGQWMHQNTLNIPRSAKVAVSA